MQAAKEARDRAAQLEAQMATLRANADTAVANAAPPPPDDTAARRAAQLSEEVAAQQRAALEAVKRAAQLEHALESKAAAQAVVQAELVAAQDEKAAVVKDLQSAARCSDTCEPPKTVAAHNVSRHTLRGIKGFGVMYARDVQARRRRRQSLCWSKSGYASRWARPTRR